MSENTKSLRQEIVEAESKPLQHDIMAGAADTRRSLAPESASQAITFAALMAKSHSAVPQMFRNNQGLCLGVTMDAMTFGFNPFALARSAYDVSGTLGYEAKIFAAALNTSGFLKKRLRFEYRGDIKGTHKITTKSGTRDAPAGTLVCKVIGELVGEETPLEWETPEIGQITTKNSPLWYSDPKLQLTYYAMRSWVRVHVPEAMLGIRTADELMDREEPDEPPAPRQTLIERVKARREAEAEPDPDTAIVAKALEQASPEITEVEAEPVEAAPEAEAATPEDTAPAPVKTRTRKKAVKPEEAKAAPSAEVVTEEPAPSAPADEPGRPKTTEEALDLLKVSVAEKNTREEVETAKLDWMLLITEFTRDEQFDLQAAADEIVARRRLAIGRKAAGG